MSRAEKFIQDYTSNCSNEIIGGGWSNGEFVPLYHPWLTPYDARRAVEIAGEEMMEWLQENAYKYSTVGFYTDAMVTDLKQGI